ncbi:outer membrane protein assembly factor BamB family protein [Gordonia liuliyuniae]|uniref:PQQ-binding-like beta-propeller repeat protein n=1 Tax=Gordonia liuliyuniae TaxID=2911517 RepID=A0ABS9IWN1_9ACTN|nr:PQQ-binding-like beta-propeller repeat protein [Gordonia liuliyuniae]MCF8589981.1 PQQ-binding-like beta-propeller repeat protein [Gordonia liuliyuniae]
MTQAVRRRRSSRLVFAALAAVLALIATACSDGHRDLRAQPAAGWSSYGGNGANANFTYSSVPEDLQLSWTRSAGGRMLAQVAIDGGGNVASTSQAPAGCDFQVLDQRSGRKNFCKRLGPEAAINTAFYDQLGQPYIGKAGLFIAYSSGGAIRWRLRTEGLGLSAKSAGPGRVLVATTGGQVMLVNAQTGKLTAPQKRFRPRSAGTDPTAGADQCADGGPECAIAAPPAVDAATNRVFLNVFPQGAKNSQLTALTYVDATGEEKINTLWTADLGGGMAGPASLSADGTTVYAFGRDGKLYAVDASNGRVRWSHRLDDAGFSTLSVAPDGTIVPAGGLGSPLTILHDDGDHVTEVAHRDDVASAGVGTQTTTGAVWAVVREGADQQLVLTEFDTKTGKTKRSLPLPDASGFSTGVAVSAAGQLAVSVTGGTVYFFDRRS